MKILIVEDEKITRISLSNTLKKEGYDITAVENGTLGLQQVDTDLYNVVITDLRLPGADGLEILRRVKERNHQCEVIIITAYASVNTAIEALKYGAYDYITKPFSPDKLLSVLKNIAQLQEVKDENTKLRNRLNLFENKNIIAHTPAMRQLIETVKIVAKHDSTVLIQGESGTGKELIAQSIHYYSTRKDKPFIPINCAAIPESLLESALFGHEKGAFSGAINQHIGYFERAHSGTLFIDDIDDLPLALQVKLLRILQEKELVRVGGTDTIPIDVRVVCATKINLSEKVREGTFREDLYYRLNIIPLTIPPLRERADDIPVLIDHFLQKYGAKTRLQSIPVSFINKLMSHDWPGNVRELENIVERMIALSTGTELNMNIDLSSLESTGGKWDKNKREVYPGYQTFMRNKEEEIIRWALQTTNNNVKKAAELLDLPRSTLRSRIEKLKLI